MGADLLSLVQPQGGWFAVVGIKKEGGVQQYMVQTREEVDALTEKLLKHEFDVYFGVAKYKDDSSRFQSNVQALRAFWLDLDCGPDKAAPHPRTGKINGYIDQAAAFAALKSFVKEHNLPRPTLVNSGRGVHVYWPLTEDITPEAWQPIAHYFRDLCLDWGLIVDRAVFETARILRIPDTLNYKGDEPAPVTLAYVGEPVDLEEFCSAIGYSRALAANPEKRKSYLAGTVSEMVRSNVSFSFKAILEKTQTGNGCAQIASIIADRETLEEPRWFDALSIAAFCTDKEEAIKAVSEGHPGYNFEAALRKTEHIQGPHTCAIFDRNNPGICGNCPISANVKSPISLGKFFKDGGEKEVVVKTEDGEEEVFPFPTLPAGYVRLEKGGIALNIETGEEGEPKVVFPFDLYVRSRTNDTLIGDGSIVYFHSPNDGVRKFSLANTTLVDRQALKHTLAFNGILANDKQYQNILTYLIVSVNAQMLAEKADPSYHQFGWKQDNNAFLIGERLVSTKGIEFVTPSKTTRQLASQMYRKGSLEKWKEVFNLYKEPGLEDHAFGALTAFGAPLLRFLGHNGGLINLVHPRSGTGKTTILRACMSVYGHPTELLSQNNDTHVSKIQKLGIMSNLPFCMDELSNMKPEHASELLYALTQGKGKDRMKSSTNELRENFSTWQTIGLSSSNSSIYDKLQLIKSLPEGESMRLFEYNVGYNTVLDPYEAKMAFDMTLMENFGHAGLIYMDFLVKNLEQVVIGLRRAQEKLDRELQATPRERFWTGMMACNLHSGTISGQLGLHDFNMSAIYARAGYHFLRLRDSMDKNEQQPISILGEFLNKHNVNILVIKDSLDARTQMPHAPIVTPRGELLVRYEPDTFKMYISASAFRRYCIDRSISYKDLIADLTKAGVCTGVTAKRMSKGTEVNSPPVNALCLDTTNHGYLQIQVSGDTDA